MNIHGEKTRFLEAEWQKVRVITPYHSKPDF